MFLVGELSSAVLCFVSVVVLKQKTAYEMRISDWSSDVCSSDLEATALAGVLGPDNCFGLAWTVVHLIESAPGWSVEHVPSGSSPLLDTLRGRASNAQDGASHGVGA